LGRGKANRRRSIDVTTDDDVSPYNVPDDTDMPPRVPCLVTFLQPFRLVENTKTKNWTASLEQVNGGTWDYVELHRIVGGLDIGMPPPFHMVVGHDGALALPPAPELRTTTAAVKAFNRSLGALLLGGTYCNAIGLDGLETGSILNWKFIRINGMKDGPNGFQVRARLQGSGALEAINLHQPRTVTFKELADSMKAGMALLSAAPEVSADLLLRGTTSLARRDWAGSLSNLWIVIEQLTSNLWRRDVTDRAQNSQAIPGRLRQLQDNRTWTISSKHELLHQIGTIEIALLETLGTARKARNDLSHRGTSPEERDAWAALDSCLGLWKLICPSSPIPLKDLDLKNHLLSDPFLPHRPTKIEPVAWFDYPRLPGEKEIEEQERLDRRNREPSSESDSSGIE
jgi:hypothetical protein